MAYGELAQARMEAEIRKWEENKGVWFRSSQGRRGREVADGEGAEGGYQEEE